MLPAPPKLLKVLYKTNGSSTTKINVLFIIKLFRSYFKITQVASKCAIKSPCLTLPPLHLSDFHCLLVAMAIPSGDADCSKSGGVVLGSVPWLAFVLVLTSHTVTEWFGWHLLFQNRDQSNECKFSWLFHLFHLKR